MKSGGEFMAGRGPTGPPSFPKCSVAQTIYWIVLVRVGEISIGQILDWTDIMYMCAVAGKIYPNAI